MIGEAKWAHVSYMNAKIKSEKQGRHRHTDKEEPVVLE